MGDPDKPIRWGARMHDETVADKNGCWSFDALIPGLRYSVSGREGPEERFLFHEEFTTMPGETIELGDVQAPAENGE